MGCPGDWQPDCDAGPAHPRPTTTSGRGTFTLPAGSLRLQGRDQRQWDENYGAGGVSNGGEHRAHARRRPGDVLLRPRHHWSSSNTAQGRSVTVPGSVPVELGCAGGLGSRTAWRLAAGSRRRRHVHLDAHATSRRATTRSRWRTNLCWDENYGAGGAPDGANISFTVRRTSPVTFTLRARDARPRPSGERAGRLPGPGQGKAHWMEPGRSPGRPTRSRRPTTPASLAGGCSRPTDAGLAADGERSPAATGPRR